MADDPTWRADLQAMEFAIPGHGAKAFMHRLAFRALLGAATPDTCLAFSRQHILTFQRAALAKIARKALDGQRNLSLTSRDFRRAADQG